MSAWHNEIEGYSADWISNLIEAGLIPAGDVDERSIVDIRPSDLAGYDTCHFFAGFGGWPYALRLAGWPENRPVWTGSCPCQPFSVAGKQAGFDDPRHLWPAWRDLIAERLPATIFGEQSAAAADWLSLVRSDLEALGYAVGCIPMEAASNDADHYRDRYWFVADRNSERRYGIDPLLRASQRGRNATDLPEVARHGSGLLANGDGERSQVKVGQSRDIGAEQPTLAGSGVCAMDDGSGERGDGLKNTSWPTARSGAENSGDWGDGWTEQQFRNAGFTCAAAIIDGHQYIECPDGKWRRLPPPRVRWLGTRIPARVSKLRAIGNAIDHRPAVAFIQAYMSARGIAAE